MNKTMRRVVVSETNFSHDGLAVLGEVIKETRFTILYRDRISGELVRRSKYGRAWIEERPVDVVN